MDPFYIQSQGQLSPGVLGPPAKPKTPGILGDVLDNIFLGGSVRVAREHRLKQQMMQQQMEQNAQIAEMIGGLGQGSPEPGGQGPAMGGPPAGAPRRGGMLPDQLKQALAISAAQAGDPDKAAKILEMDVRQAEDGSLYDGKTGAVLSRLPKRQVVNGFNTDLYAPNAPSFIPELPPGTMPDGRGGIQNLPNLPEAMGQQRGAEEGAVQAARAPYAVTPIPQADGSVATFRNDQLPGGPQGAPRLGGQARGDRNNNPLNLEATVQWPGMSGNDGRFAKFASPEAGMAAADQNLRAYAKRGINTVAGIIGTWAPEKENGPATANYTDYVAKRLGVDPGARLDMTNPAVRQRVASAMGEFENNRKVGGGSAAGALGSSRPAPIEANETALATARQAAAQARKLAELADQFVSINKKHGTGGVLSLPVPFMGSVGQGLQGFNSNLSAMEAITNDAIAMLRQPGSGTDSDRDMAIRRARFPNIDTPSAANEAKARRFKAEADRQERYATFLEAWVAQRGTVRGAQAAFERQRATPPRKGGAKGGKGDPRQMSDEEILAGL